MTPLHAMCLALVAGLVLSPLLPVARPLAFGIAAGLVALQVAAGRRAGRHVWPALAAYAAAFAVGWARGAAADWPVPAVKASEHVLVGDTASLSAGGDDGRWLVGLRLRGAGVVGKDGALARLWPVATEATLATDEATARRFRVHDRVVVRARNLARRQRRNFGDDEGRSAPPLFGSLVSGPLVVREAPVIAAGLERTREFLAARLGQALSGHARGIVVAMVLGDRSLLDEPDVEAFRRTGTAHLLAVSGLNVTLVSLLVLWIARAALARTPLVARFRVASVAAIAAVSSCWGYALLTGLGPPVFRAAVMTTAALAAQAIGRPPRGGRAIGLAAAILLFHDPSLTFAPGFQLSFVAVLALDGLGRWSAAGREGAARPGRLRAAAAALRGAVTTSLAATLATTPILAYHFGLVSPLGVVVNAVAVPISTWLLLPAMFLITAVGAVSPWAARGLGLVVEPAIELFMAGLRWASGLEGVCAAVSRPALHEALLLAVAGVAVVRPSRRARALALAAAAIAATSWAVRLDVAGLDRSLTVTFVDVGAGDAVLIDLPRGGRMLVDAGPRAGRGSRATDVVEAAERLGYGRLELLALTHGHEDHAAGVTAALAHVGAVRYWAPLAGAGGVRGGPPDATVSRLGARVETAPTICGARELGGVRLEVLHPCGPEARRLGENDRSLVLRLVFGDVAFLLPGDVEEAGEALLLRDAARLRATVVKLPHHGSATSASEPFVDAVRPEIAVASCSSSRRRPLPHPPLVDRLAARGVRVVSTAELGALRFRTDGRGLRAWSARVGELELSR